MRRTGHQTEAGDLMTVAMPPETAKRPPQFGRRGPGDSLIGRTDETHHNPHAPQLKLIAIP